MAIKNPEDKIDDLICNPGQFFQEPGDVLVLDLSDALKIRILESWEQEIIQLEHAEEENMGEGDLDLLPQIHQALTALRLGSG